MDVLPLASFKVIFAPLRAMKVATMVLPLLLVQSSSVGIDASAIL